VPYVALTSIRVVEILAWLIVSLYQAVFTENVFVVRLSLILFWAMSLFDVALIITANYSFLSIDTC